MPRSWDIAARVRELDPVPLVEAFVEQSLESRRTRSASPVLQLKDVLSPTGTLEQVFLLALLSRSYPDLNSAIEPEWLHHECTDEVWRLKGAAKKGLQAGRAALVDRVRGDRTSLGGYGRILGYPLGHVQIEVQSSALDLGFGSEFITVRDLDREHLAVEHVAFHKRRPFELALLGVLRLSHPGSDLGSVLVRIPVAKKFLGVRLRGDNHVDRDLPAGTLDAFRR